MQRTTLRPTPVRCPTTVEEFRDREYPQLKGKTYLDHGGTTVCMAGLAGDSRDGY